MKRAIMILAVVITGTMSMMAHHDDECRTCGGKGVITCPDCNGNPPICQICKGLGNVICDYCHGDSYTCPVCHGSKYYNNATCSACKGVGKVRDCSHCDRKGYVKCPGIPKDCFNGNQVCRRCDGLNKVLCPDCQ
ncbi:MAG: hypothetical protein IJJ68_02925 [Prevotella sp.]|nr:hypothetical protein [Prevotella sp.]MBR4369355.1 hypothetical protein [Prevotella sp.]